MIFITAGYETTSNTMGAMMYFLAKNPDVQEKLYEEILDVVGDDHDGDYYDGDYDNDAYYYHYILPKNEPTFVEIYRAFRIPKIIFVAAIASKPMMLNKAR